MSHPFFPTNAEPDERAGIVFFEALKLPPDEHEAFLNHECGSDESLLSEVAGLLRDHRNAGSFLSGEAPAATGLETAIARLTPEETGGKIGPYKLLQQIGEGGCGVVFMAEQEEPVRRRVAVKVIKLGMDTKQVIARFEAERQALALMDHPNIARVLDAGATDAGRPYFVMELVRGIRITSYCDQNNLPTEARLGLFTQVCQAIQHAHQKGIIHRDIKPSNILVTLHDGVPVPKVIDFGIAKATTGQRLTDKTIFTAFEQFIGTPAYMSPEQAEMSGLDIDTRSDIYALGVLLYELLTGQTPFDAKELLASGLDAMRRTIREQEPPRPSTRLSTMLAADVTSVARHHQTESAKLTHSISGDLDWIVMKALEKDRTRRYETANGLAQDIQRHLNDEPVTARPASNLYRFRKLVRRNKIAFAAASAVVAALLIGLGASTWMFFKEKQARERAVAAEQEQGRLRQLAEVQERKATAEASRSTQVAQFLKDMLKGVRPSVALGRDTTVLREILDKTAERIGKDLKDQPEVGADLRHTLGEIYGEIGDDAKAEILYQEALAMRRKLFGNEDLLVAKTLASLARLRISRIGRGDEVGTEEESLLREGLAIRRKLLGEEHEEVGVLLGDLAYTRSLQGKFAEAEVMQRETLAIQRKRLGNEHLSVAESLNILGVLLFRQGKFAEAEKLYREALAIERKLKGNEHPDLIIAILNLSQVLEMLNQLAEAEVGYREGLSLAEKMLGKAHPITILYFRGLEIFLRRQGRSVEAEISCRERLATLRKLVGDEHQSVAYALDFLAENLVSQGRVAEAETLNREALAIFRKTLGPAHGDTEGCLSDQENVLLRQGKSAEAETLRREELVTIRKLFGDKHQKVADALFNLAAIVDGQGRVEEAEILLREALSIVRKLFGDGHPDTAKAVYNVEKALLRRGNAAGAETLRREELAMQRKLLGNEHSNVADSLYFLALDVGRQGRLGESETLFREVLSLIKKKSGDVHPDTAKAIQNVAVNILRQGNGPLAETLFAETLAILNKLLENERMRPGEEHADVSVALNNLAIALRFQGKLAEAEKAYREVLELKRKRWGNDHLEVVDALLNLAQVVGHQGRAETETLHRENLRICKKLVGDKHPKVVSIK